MQATTMSAVTTDTNVMQANIWNHGITENTASMGGSESDSDNVSIGSSRGHNTTITGAIGTKDGMSETKTEEKTMWGSDIGTDGATSGTSTLWGSGVGANGMLPHHDGNSLWNRPPSSASGTWGEKPESGNLMAMFKGIANDGLGVVVGAGGPSSSDIWKIDSQTRLVDAFHSQSVASVSADPWNPSTYSTKPSELFGLGFQRSSSSSTGWGQDLQSSDAKNSWATQSAVGDNSSEVFTSDVGGVGRGELSVGDDSGPPVQGSGAAAAAAPGSGSIRGSQSVGGSSGNGSTADPSDELISRMINSNEGWGKRVVHQDTPWDTESVVVPAVADVQEQAGANSGMQPTPAAVDMSGLYWNDGTSSSGRPVGINNEWDGDIGVWNGPPGSNPSQDSGAPSWGASGGGGAMKDSWLVGASGPPHGWMDGSMFPQPPGGGTATASLSGMLKDSFLQHPPPNMMPNDMSWMSGSSGGGGGGRGLDNDASNWGVGQPPFGGGFGGSRGFDPPPRIGGGPGGSLKIDTWGESQAGGGPSWGGQDNKFGGGAANNAAQLQQLQQLVMSLGNDKAAALNLLRDVGDISKLIPPPNIAGGAGGQPEPVRGRPLRGQSVSDLPPPPLTPTDPFPQQFGSHGLGRSAFQPPPPSGFPPGGQRSMMNTGPTNWNQPPGSGSSGNSGMGNFGGNSNNSMNSFMRSRSVMEQPVMPPPLPAEQMSPNTIQSLILQNKLQPLLQERSMLHSSTMNFTPAVRQQRMDAVNAQIAAIKRQFETVVAGAGSAPMFPGGGSHGRVGSDPAAGLSVLLNQLSGRGMPPSAGGRGRPGEQDLRGRGPGGSQDIADLLKDLSLLGGGGRGGGMGGSNLDMNMLGGGGGGGPSDHWDPSRTGASNPGAFKSQWSPDNFAGFGNVGGKPAPPPGLGGGDGSWNPGSSTLGGTAGAGNMMNNNSINNSWLLLRNCYQMDDSMLQILCLRHGLVQSLHVNRSAGLALVLYSGRESVLSAFNNLNNMATGTGGGSKLTAELLLEEDVVRLMAAGGRGTGGAWMMLSTSRLGAAPAPGGGQQRNGGGGIW